MPGGRAAGGRVIDVGGTPTPTGFVLVVVVGFFYMSAAHIHAGLHAGKKFLKIFFKFSRHLAALLSGGLKNPWVTITKDNGHSDISVRIIRGALSRCGQ